MNVNNSETENVSEFPTQGDSKPMSQKPKLVALVPLLLSIVSLFASASTVYFAFGPWQQFKNTDPQLDGFVPPRSIADLVAKVQDSTVTVYCDVDEDNSFVGSGWAMAIETDFEKEYPTAIVTNHHVIEDCLDGKGEISVKQLSGREYRAIVDNWDSENDLAVIVTKLKLKPLPLSANPPAAGYWVMAVGSPKDFEGSIAFGNVVNVSTSNEIFITASLSGGNSGGPLIDNEGYVLGTNTWRGIDDVEFNGAMSLDAMCGGIMKCKDDTYWNWD